MLYCNRINVSEWNGITKTTSASKECDTCHYL